MVAGVRGSGAAAGAGAVGLPARVRLGYGAGSVATGAFATVPGLLLLPFLTDSLGVAAGWAGVIIFAPKLIDVIINPIAGRVSDRTVDPRGPRRPWLLRAGIVLAVGFALLFAAPGLGGRGPEAVWVVVMSAVCAVGYAFFQVPLIAMPAEMTDSYTERTRLMTWRVALLALTILVSGATAPIIRDAVGGRNGYRVMGVAIAVLILVGALAAYCGTRVAPVGRIGPGVGSLAAQLRIVAAARDFRWLLGTYVLQAVAVGAMLAGVDYLAREVLGRPGATTIVFVCFVAPALVFTPVWVRVGIRTGKKTGFVAASLVMAAGAAATASALVAPAAVVYVAVGLVGVGYAGCQAFPLAMLPDAAAHDAQVTGTSRSGVYTGVWTASETVALAIGPGLYAGTLAFGGYRSSVDTATVQPATAVVAIVLGMSVLPAVLIMVSLAWLARYRLDAATVDGPRGGDGAQSG